MTEYEFKGIQKVKAVMAEFGFRMTSAEGGTMDSGMAVFEGDVGTVRIMKDRGQWFHEGNALELRPYGLWKAFNSLDEFLVSIRNYHGNKKRRKAQPIHPPDGVFPCRFIHRR